LNRVSEPNIIRLGSLVFTIFVKFEDEVLTLNSKDYPMLGWWTTVRELKKIVRQRIEMTKGHSTGLHFIMANSNGTIFENLLYRIEEYGISNMSICNAYFKPWNDILDYTEIQLRLQDDRPEDIQALLESCEKCRSLRIILLESEFDVYTTMRTSFWAQILAGEFCSLMAPCVRIGMPVNETYCQTSALSISLWNDNIGAVKELLRLNSSPNGDYKIQTGKNWKLMSPLQLVVNGLSFKKFSENKCLKYLKLLIDCKADLSNDWALISAVRKGLLKIASYLISEGCNVEVVEVVQGFFMTPLIQAVKCEDINLVRLLHGVGGASPNVIAKGAYLSAFMLAVSQNSIQIVKYFLQNPNQQRMELQNILHLVCDFTNNVIHIIWTMVQSPVASFVIMDRRNRTVFDMANSKAMSDLLYQSLDYRSLPFK